MCGIAGHVASADAGRSPRDAHALVRAMADALAHRGPDASGVHGSGLATLGHTRLSIIDLSTGANQPMLSGDGQIVLVFNGEIYNFRELAAELRDAGVVLRTRSDTEVLLQLYRLHGAVVRQQDARHVRVRDLGRARGGAWCWGAIDWARSRSTFTSASAGCRSRRSCRRCSPTATSSAAPTRRRFTPT